MDNQLTLIEPTLTKMNHAQIHGRENRTPSLTEPVPCKHCGGHASLWMEHLIGGVELYWYECDCCHEYPDTTGTAVGALRTWNGIQLGVIRPKSKRFWGVGF